MKKIELPLYSWFYSNQQGKWVMNAYSGSRGTSTTNGCLCNTTFNYRVSIKTPADRDSFIEAECFFILPIKDGGIKTEPVKKEFENSEKGLEDAAVWLYRQEEKRSDILPSTEDKK